MDRFLRVSQLIPSTAANQSEFSQKIPRPPNGFKWCVRKIYCDLVSIVAGLNCVLVFNDKPATTPINTSSRKILGSVSIGITTGSITISSEDFPYGSLVVNDYQITFYFQWGSAAAGLHMHVLLELVPCSAIDQLKSDLLQN